MTLQEYEALHDRARGGYMMCINAMIMVFQMCHTISKENVLDAASLLKDWEELKVENKEDLFEYEAMTTLSNAFWGRVSIV